MKTILIALAALLGNQAAAASHDHQHVPHNMIVVGIDEVHASHLVYKQPHNFQVILSVKFSDVVQAEYKSARAAHPADTFIFLLDAGDISDIRNATRLTGALFRRGSDDLRVDIVPAVTLEHDDFKVVYFDELPLSLAR